MSVFVLLCAASAASAQDWARDMFDNTSHDFGTVARGAKVEHHFTFENIYVEDAHVLSAKVSCGCTKPTVPGEIIKTWKKGDIVATVDTRGFLGQKDVTITVTFDKPFVAEVQLHIHCYIRSDVVVQPGVVQFGPVAPGAGGRQRVRIDYAGRNDWQIQRLECANSSISAQATPVARGNGRVTYDLDVTLAKDAPPGYIRDSLFLITNDTNPRAARVPVPVEGLVQQAGIAAHPDPLFMGVVDAGKPVTRLLVLQGGAPFRISRIVCSDRRFQCTVPDTAASLHRLSVTFSGDSAAGNVNGKLFIETDAVAGSVMQVPVSVQVVAPAATAETAVPATDAPVDLRPPPTPQPSTRREL